MSELVHISEVLKEIIQELGVEREREENAGEGNERDREAAGQR